MAIGNLEYIKSASGTSVSSLTVTDCFSSTYDVYMIQMNEYDTTANTSPLFRFLDSGGTEISNSNYDMANSVLRAGNTPLEEIATNSTRIANFSYATTTNKGMGNTIIVFNPYDSSTYSFLMYQTAHWQHINNYMEGRKSIAVLKEAAIHSGFKIYADSGTIDIISLSVFGVR
jgi:hypothetical protein